MIPTVCPEDAPPGEQEVFRRLRDDSGTEGWTVLHSLDLARHVERVAGEADFVVLVPGHGILVIEVKSHRRVRRDPRGWWLGNEIEPDTRGPFKQASDAMRSIRDYLIGRDPSFKSIIIWSAVCFPKLDFTITSSEWHSWQVIDRNRLCRSPISQIVTAVLAEGRQLLLQKGIDAAKHPERHASAERCKATAAALRPRFELAMSPRSRRQELDRELLELTEEQFVALDQASLNPRVIFTGAAGTGKTVLAMEALRREWVANRGTKAALFCFNKLLGRELEERAHKICPGPLVTNIDRWLTALAGERITKSDKERKDYFRGWLSSLAMKSLLEESGDPPFDFLVIDEAQDLFQPHFLDVLDLALKGGLAGGRWLMFGDFVGQDIFCQGQMGLKAFLTERCPTAARFLLTANCRNTLPISDYVELLGQLRPPYARVLRGDDHQDPKLSYWTTRSDQLVQVKTFLEESFAVGFSPRDIVLLSAKPNDSLGEELARDSGWSSRVAPYTGTHDRISYTTIQRFKGLEAPVVVITDFVSVDSAHQQSLFYIGLSRALHRLGIFLHEDLKSFVRAIT